MPTASASSRWLASVRLFSEISTSQTGSDPPASARVSSKARLTVLAARDTTALKAVADGIAARGGRALAVGADVTDAGSVRDVVDQAVSVFGRLDAAFNNASAGPLPAPLADIDPDEFDLGIATNVRGTFLGMKFQIPAMLASGGGATREMASHARRDAPPTRPADLAGETGVNPV